MLSNAEPLDVPLSRSVQPHDELSPKPTMDTVNTHCSLSNVRTVAFTYGHAESPKKDDIHDNLTKL